MPWWWPFACGGAFLVTACVTDIVRKFAFRYRVVDRPDGARKLHAAPTPLLGGVALYVGVAAPMVVLLGATSSLTGGEIGTKEFVGFLLGGAVLVSGGIWDDFRRLSARVSFLFPLAAAVIATAAGIGISKLTNPLGMMPFVLGASVSALFTFVWLLVTTYTTKLLDGVDGLATSVTGVGCIMITLLALTERYYQPDVALFAGIAAVACVAFVFWNAPPARIFLGEGGSTFLGFMLGTLAVISGGKVATALLVLGIPALDVAFVVLRRLLQRKNPFTSSDRQHLHLLLRDRGFTARQVLALYTGVAFLFGVTTLLFASWQKILALAILGLLAALGAVWLTRRPQNNL